MITVHTDGSIYPNPSGPCGWGFTAVDDETGELHEEYGGRGASPGNSNNRAELAAVIYALRWLDGRQAMIWSDSQYVVNGLNLWAPAWAARGWRRQRHGKFEIVPNADLWERSLRYLKGGQQIGWVRGHNGDAANERADALALSGRLSVQDAGPTVFSHVSL